MGGSDEGEVRYYLPRLRQFVSVTFLNEATRRGNLIVAEQLQSILGNLLVDAEKQVINQSLFDRNSAEQLVAALLQPCPEISSSTDALLSEETIEDADDEDEDGDE